MLAPTLILAALLVSPQGLPPTTYYVETTGSNTNPGTILLPFRTIDHAAGVVGPGDTVLIRGGNYNERVTCSISGTAAAPIRFASYPGETAVLDGTGFSMGYGDGVFHIPGPSAGGGLSYLVVEGLRVQNSAWAGFACWGSSFITLRNNRTDTTGSSGIFVGNSTDIRVEDNEIVNACTAGDQECLSVAKSSRVLVRGNHVHHSAGAATGGEGIDIKNGSTYCVVMNNLVHDLTKVGIYIDAFKTASHDILVVGNEVHDTVVGIALASEGGALLERVCVAGNLLHDSGRTAGGGGSAGIVISTWGTAATHPMRDLWITNNTCYQNSAGGISVQPNSLRGLTVIRNNIMAENLGGQLGIATSEGFLDTMQVDHNLSYSSTGVAGPREFTWGESYLSVDPLLVNPAAGNYRLRRTSPARDSGASEIFPRAWDLEGLLRVCGETGIRDRGAFEYCGL